MEKGIESFILYKKCPLKDYVVKLWGGGKEEVRNWLRCFVEGIL
jgi:hypothetical protein